MANEIQTVDTVAQKLAVKTNNELTAIMANSDSWKLFMSKMSASQQKQIMFDLYGYINKNAETVSQLKSNEIMARVIDCYAQGFTLQDGDCYILPFKNKIKDRNTGEESWVTVATLVPGYKGVVRLAMQSSLFKHFDCVPVIKESIAKFDYRRGVPIFKDDYIPNGNEKTIGYFAYSETHDGMVREIYRSNEWFIDFAIRKSPQSRNAKKLVGVWASDFESMCKKTALKQLAKLAPKVKNPTEQQEQFFNYANTDDEPQDDRPPYIDVDGVVVSENQDLYDKTLPFDEPPEDYGEQDQDDTDEFVCDNCDGKMSEKVYEYSMKKFGKPLCFKCQKKNNGQ